jgi:methyl-accepting chemotaxis protein
MFDKQHPLVCSGVFSSTREQHFDLSMSHICWKAKFRTAIMNHEVLDVAMITKDNCCELGKWLHDEKNRQQMRHLKSYRDCVAKHTMVHIEAGKVAELANAGNYYEALQALNGMSAFSQVFMALISSTFCLNEDINIENLVDDDVSYSLAINSQWMPVLSF